MVCMCVLMHSCFIKNSFNIILVNNPSFYDGGVTFGIRAMSNDQQCFYGEECVLPI
jgi:hypothetical protein